MQHVDSKVVLSVYVCTIIDQKLAGVWITFEGCEMESNETITIVLGVDPGGHLRMICLFFGQIQQSFQTFDAVVECAFV